MFPQSSASSSNGPELLADGIRTYTQEGPKSALHLFLEAQRLFRDAGDRENEAIATGYIANCNRKLGNLEEALSYAQQALRMKEAIGNQDEIGKTHNQLGLIYWERSEYQAAIQHLQQSIQIASTVGDRELEGSARNNFGLVLDERGEYKQSLAQYQAALELHRASHFERGEGDTLGNIGGIYLLLGRFREALPYYRQALEISQRLGLKPAASDDLGNIALCLAGLGNTDEALASFDHALQIARDSGLAKEEADWHKGKGSTLVSLGRYDMALHEYAAGEAVYERSGLQRELVEALIGSGVLYELLGDGATAEARFQQALDLARKIGNTTGENASLLALGDLERRRRRLDVSDTYLARTLERAGASEDEGTMVAALQQRARNEADRKHYDMALQNAVEAARVADRLGNLPAIGRSQLVLGEVYRLRGEAGEALKALDSAEAAQEQLRDPELGWSLLYERGRTLAATGDTDGAVAAYKSAIALIEATRAEISEEHYRAGYIQDRYQVYVALVELLVQLRKPDSAFFYSEKLRARSYLDQLDKSVVSRPAEAQQTLGQMRRQIQTLRQDIQKEYSVEEKQRRGQALQLYSQELDGAEREYQKLLSSYVPSPTEGQMLAPPGASTIQRRLPPRTAVVEYVVGPKTLSILVLTSAQTVGMAVPASSESLSSRVELLRDLISRRKPEWNQPAKGLRQLLIAPLEQAGLLAGIDKLFVVPDGVLNYVPFAALPVGTGRFLADKLTVVYLPSAMVLLEFHPTSSEGTMLALAPAQATLPASEPEVRSIVARFHNSSRAVAGKSATETLFKQVAGQYEFLHIATHGSLNRNAPLLSYLEFNSDAQNDGRLELHEILATRLRARLVTLSACETALGAGYFSEDPPGNEFVSLMRAFLDAGGHNVMASLWTVNDASTRLLMDRFYQHLPDTDVARALSRAQKELRGISSRYQHPYYWAAFILSGPVN